MEKLKILKQYSIEYDKRKILKINIFMIICSLTATLILTVGLSYLTVGRIFPIYKNLGELLNGIISYRMLREPIISKFFADEGGISVSFVIACILGFSVIMCLLTLLFFKYKKLCLIILSFILFFICGNSILGFTGVSAVADKFYAEKIELLENYLENKKNHNEAPICAGDFTLKSGLEVSDEVEFKVKMKKPETYYFKGYVGEEYNGKGWEALKPEILIEYNNLFRALHDKNFDGRCVLAHGALSTSTDEYINEITVENVGSNSQYLYAPYENTVFKGKYKNYIGDCCYISHKISDSKKYSFNATPYKMDKIYSIKKSLTENQGEDKIREFLKQEYNYRKFCTNNYIFLPVETEKNLSVFLEKIKAPKNDEQISVSAVKKLLLEGTADFKYDENIVYVLENGDFVSDFLKRKSGYSIHFSTLGAAVFRHYGIPARFVEGFLITEKNLKDKKSNDIVEVKKSAYHCWMEYYEEGLGWVPFELTPKYIGVMKSDTPVKFIKKPKEKPEIEKIKKEKQKQNRLITKETKVNNEASMLLILFIFVAALGLLKLFKKLKKAEFRGKRFHKRDMNSPDNKKAIFAMMHSLNKLSKKRSLDYALMLEAKAIYEEAKYSNHEITLKKRDKMKKCYELLKKTSTAIISIVLLISLAGCGVNDNALDSAETTAINFVMKKVQGTEGLGYGNEWIAMDLALCNQEVPEKIFNDYLSKLNTAVKERKGVLNTGNGYKYTEYSRVIVGVNAIRERTGKGDPENISGYNLLEKLCNIENVCRQGINGPIWALIAFDSGKHKIPKVVKNDLQASREKLIKIILEAQLEDGGWTVTGGVSDVDMTAMAIESLAPYYTKLTKDKFLWIEIPENLQLEVRAAVDKGVELLSKKQLDDGGYESWETANSESVSQVITALSAIGIDCTKDKRFIKSRKNPMDALLGFLNSNGSFSHRKGDGGDYMATEQGIYSLIAFRRFRDSRKRLCEMG